MGLMDDVLNRLESLSRRVAHLESLDYSLDAQNADTVDLIHAAAVATANKLLALDAASKLPASITGDAHTVDGEHAAALHAAGSLTGTVPLANLPALDGCRLTRSTDLSVNDQTATPVGFDTESYDVGGLHDNVTNNSRVTIAVAGKYLITGIVTFDAGGQTIAAGWRLGGVTEYWGETVTPAAGGEEGRAVVVDVPSLAAGNYAEMIVWQNSGGAKDLVGAETFFTVKLQI